MYYYKRNIGDYHKKAGRLSMLEHGAYTLLIDACYDREQFPTLDEAIDWTWARTEAEIAAVKFVLSKFFTLEDGVYVQNRIKEEVDAYQHMAETNTRIAKEREEKRRKGKQSVNDSSRTVNEPCPISHESPPNQEPRTKNQEPYNTHTSASDFLPELKLVNDKLQMAGGQPVTQKQLEQTLVTFIPHYETQVLTDNQRVGKLVQWIKGDQDKAKRPAKVSRPVSGAVNQNFPESKITIPPTPETLAEFERMKQELDEFEES